MACERIYSHAGIQALQGRSDAGMRVELVCLESVSIAGESYAILRPLMEQRPWLCPKLDLLSLVAGLALELRKIKDDVLRPLQVEEAKLEGGVLDALLLMKNSAFALLDLRKCFKEAGVKKVDGFLDEDLILAQVELLGTMLQDTAFQVLNSCRNFDFVQERLQGQLRQVDALLVTPVRFP